MSHERNCWDTNNFYNMTFSDFSIVHHCPIKAQTPGLQAKVCDPSARHFQLWCHFGHCLAMISCHGQIYCTGNVAVFCFTITKPIHFLIIKDHQNLKHDTSLIRSVPNLLKAILIGRILALGFLADVFQCLPQHL